MYVIDFLEPGQYFDLSSIGGVSSALQFGRKNLLLCQLSRLKPENDEMIKLPTFNIEAIGIYQNLSKVGQKLLSCAKKPARNRCFFFGKREITPDFFTAGAYRKHGIENPGHRPQTTCCVFCTLYRMLEKLVSLHLTSQRGGMGAWALFLLRVLNSVTLKTPTIDLNFEQTHFSANSNGGLTVKCNTTYVDFMRLKFKTQLPCK